MAISVIQSGNSTLSESSNQYVSASLTGVAAGAMIVCHIGWESTSATPTIDDGTNSADGYGAVYHHTSGNYSRWAYFFNSIGGNLTFEVDYGTSVPYRVLHVWEVDPDGKVLAYDQDVGNTGTGTAINSSSLSFTGPHGIVFGSHRGYGGGYVTGTPQINSVNADGSKINTPSTSWDSTWYRIVTSGFSGAASATISSSDSWICSAISFYVVEAMPGGTSRNYIKCFDDFSGDLSNWVYTNHSPIPAIVSGELSIPDEGVVRHTKDMGAVDRWIRTDIVNRGVTLDHLILFSCDSSGNGMAVVIDNDVTPDTVRIEAITEYTTYTTYTANDVTPDDGSTNTPYPLSTGEKVTIGVTWDRTNLIVRVWADENLNEKPDSLTSWNERPADAYADLTGDYTDYGNYVGLGSWGSAVTPYFDNFTAGNFNTGIEYDTGTYSDQYGDEDITPAPDATLALIFVGFGNESVAPSNVTYNGNIANIIGRVDDGETWCVTYAYYYVLKSDEKGVTSTYQVNGHTAEEVTIAAITLQGTDVDSPVSAFNSAYGTNATSITLDVSGVSSVGDWVVDCINYYDDQSATPGPNQSPRINYIGINRGTCLGISTEVAKGSDATMSWSSSFDEGNWCSLAFAVHGAPLSVEPEYTVQKSRILVPSANDRIKPANANFDRGTVDPAWSWFWQGKSWAHLLTQGEPAMVLSGTTLPVAQPTEFGQAMYFEDGYSDALAETPGNVDLPTTGKFTVWGFCRVEADYDDYRAIIAWGFHGDYGYQFTLESNAEEAGRPTFYNHDGVGANIARPQSTPWSVPAGEWVLVACVRHSATSHEFFCFKPCVPSVGQHDIGSDPGTDDAPTGPLRMRL